MDLSKRRSSDIGSNVLKYVESVSKDAREIFAQRQQVVGMSFRFLLVRRAKPVGPIAAGCYVHGRVSPWHGFGAGR